jgi:hypothetical protein
MEPITISRDGVYKLIKNINPSKATGPDVLIHKSRPTEAILNIGAESDI